MSYWGSGPIDNDYAFTKIGANIILIKERMFKDAESVVESAYKEQSIIASLECIRLLASEFPKCAILHFGSKELAKAKELFGRWYEGAGKKVPAKYREAILANAEAEFKFYEEEVLPPRPQS